MHDKQFWDDLAAKMNTAEYWREHNLDAIRRYDEAKKWGKTAKKAALVEKYRAAAGDVRHDGYVWTLSVRDVPGLPLRVSEAPAIEENKLA